MSVIAILQARMGSTRLPGKVLKPILGKPMLTRQIERIRRSARVDRLVVATSVDQADDPIQELCDGLEVPNFRGHSTDVLDRMFQAACRFQASHVVRLTGDCPLTDPAVIDKVVETHLLEGFDYTSNIVDRSFPDGLDVEAAKVNIVEQAWRHAASRDEREHVMTYIRKRPFRFRIGNVRGPRQVFQLRWTVDEPRDYEFVCRIYESLYPIKPDFDWLDVLELLQKQPEIGQLNSLCGPEETRCNPRRIAS